MKKLYKVNFKDVASVVYADDERDAINIVQKNTCDDFEQLVCYKIDGVKEISCESDIPNGWENGYPYVDFNESHDLTTTDLVNYQTTDSLKEEVARLKKKVNRLIKKTKK